MGTPGQDDVGLVHRAQQGDREAFSELFARYHPPVLNYVYHQLGDRAAAEDVVQDAFLRAHQRLGQLGPPWDFKSWVYRIASNLTVDHVRGQRRFVDSEEPEDLLGPPTTRRPMERRLQQEETRQAVRRTLEALPTVYRQALVLRELQALSYEETARALECSYDNARQLVHRARLRFRALHAMQPAAAAPGCQALGDLLTAEVDDALAPDERQAVKAHLAVCTECRETRKDLKAMAGLLGVLPALEPDPAWAAQVLERIGAGGGGGGGGTGGAAENLPAPAVAAPPGGSALAGLGAAPLMAAGALVLGALVLAAGFALAAGGPHLPAMPPPPEATSTPPASPPASPAAPLPPAASPAPPSATPSAAPSPTLGPPVAHAVADANCRFGPGLVYDVIGYFHSGQSSPIAGRNAETTWWWIDRLEAPGHCWVWAGAASTTGDLSGVPVVAAPPTPTPADTQPPTVSASYAPTGSGRPHQFEQVTFTALGSDDRALARLEIWVRPPGANAFTRVAVCEGTATCQHTAGPYAPGTLAYQAKAWDAAGNQAETPILQVTIHPSIF